MSTDEAVSPSGQYDEDQPGAEAEAEHGADASGEPVEVLQDSNKSFIRHMVGSLRAGADLSRIPFPTFILEPRSLLEKLTDLISYPELLVQAQDFTCPVARMSAFVRWYLSGYHVRPKAVKKPYNPVLGETFQCFWEFPTPPTFVGGTLASPTFGVDALPAPLHEALSKPLGAQALLNVPGMPSPQSDGSPSPAAALPPTHRPSRVHFVAEQVSHHPPVTALHCESRDHGVEGCGWYSPRSKFLGNSVASIGEGWAAFRFSRVGGAASSEAGEGDGACEVYTMTWPSAYVRGILWGKLIMEVGGKVQIACRESGVSCELEFKTKPMFGGAYGKVAGKIFITAAGAARAAKLAREAADGVGPVGSGPMAAAESDKGSKECVRVVEGQWGGVVNIKPGPAAGMVKESTQFALRVASERIAAATALHAEAYAVGGGFDNTDVSWIDPPTGGVPLMTPPSTRYRMQFPPFCERVENFSRKSVTVGFVWHFFVVSGSFPASSFHSSVWVSLTKALGGAPGYGVRAPEQACGVADPDAANSAKHEVENAQRELRHAREEAGETWRPAFFRPAVDRILTPPIALPQDASAGVGVPTKQGGGGGCWQYWLHSAAQSLWPTGEASAPLPSRKVIQAVTEGSQTPPVVCDDEHDAPPACDPSNVGDALFAPFDDHCRWGVMDESLVKGMLRAPAVATLPGAGS